MLGRSREADVTVAHPLISRRHCEIFENSGLLMLRNLASLNGTMIGGRRIELAPLLPDGEFMIGPVTFRVLYAYDGDLESLPDTRFLDEVAEATEAGLGDPTSAPAEEVPMFEVDAALPAEPAGASESSELAMADFMALADADPEEALPAVPARPAQASPPATTGPRWPPMAVDKLPTRPITSALDEPLEVDSSLQSGVTAWNRPGRLSPKPWKDRGLRGFRRGRAGRFRRASAGGFHRGRTGGFRRGRVARPARNAAGRDFGRGGRRTGGQGETTSQGRTACQGETAGGKSA